MLVSWAQRWHWLLCSCFRNQSFSSNSLVSSSSHSSSYHHFRVFSCCLSSCCCLEYSPVPSLSALWYNRQSPMPNLSGFDSCNTAQAVSAYSQLSPSWHGVFLGPCWQTSIKKWCSPTQKGSWGGNSGNLDFFLIEAIWLPTIHSKTNSRIHAAQQWSKGPWSTPQVFYALSSQQWVPMMRIENGTGIRCASY